jgi:hypothetical protein
VHRPRVYFQHHKTRNYLLDRPCCSHQTWPALPQGKTSFHNSILCQIPHPSISSRSRLRHRIQASWYLRLWLHRSERVHRLLQYSSLGRCRIPLLAFVSKSWGSQRYHYTHKATTDQDHHRLCWYHHYKSSCNSSLHLPRGRHRSRPYCRRSIHLNILYLRRRNREIDMSTGKLHSSFLVSQLEQPRRR